jgi:ribonuclease BN (tRNA processing enzyme)
MHRLLEAGVTIFEISHLFYSHFHPDHSAEFVPFLFSTKYSDGYHRSKPLSVIGGRGLLDFYKKLRGVYGQWIELAPHMLDIIEFDNHARDSRRFEAFNVETMPVAHNPESIAYRITAPNLQSVVYSGDTGYSENLIELAKDTDLLICESALPDDLRASGHLTPSLAGEIATRAKARKLVLTHFYPECEQVDIEQECRKTYNGPLILAEDLMQIEII